MNATAATLIVPAGTTAATAERVARRIYQEYGEIGARQYISSKRDTSHTEEEKAYWRVVTEYLDDWLKPITGGGLDGRSRY